ncbi:MAG TPA: hypothetical protein VH328_03210, partial [Burkholderiaceae bacterium]|nr:hypothetical protein [Burkholderiaceae bacterium]
SNDPAFTQPIKVPDGFLGAALPVPHPQGGPLYVRLRDNPTVINPTTVVAQDIPPTADEAARAAVRSSATRTENQPAAVSQTDAN